MENILKERLRKIKILIENGVTGNIDTGKIYNKKGKEITTKKGKGYLGIGIMLDYKLYSVYQHQFIYYLATGEVVDNIDHKNGIRTDNRFDNLRSITQQKNHFNRTKAKGYHKDKRTNKWIAEIKVNGENIYLGSYFTENEAHNAYLEAKKKYHLI